MTLRLLEVIVGSEGEAAAARLIEAQTAVIVSRIALKDARVALRVLVPAEATEVLSDALAEALDGSDGFRIILVPVEATLPPFEESLSEEERTRHAHEARLAAARISREELYADVTAQAELTPVYAVTIALSSVVAALGLVSGDAAVIIGAMVIAPLLGPNVAFSLAVTLGDTALSLRALRAGAAGVAVAAALSLALGMWLDVDPQSVEIARRTHVGVADVVLALAAGSAGALAFTSGVPAVLIGVMVAVALLPPLVAAGLLAGAGHGSAALGAVLLLLVNVTCVNLAGVITFVLRGIHPRRWWEAEKARQATRKALLFWASLLGLLLVLVLVLSRR